ncbi:MAG: hypothetical protein QXU98_08315 [Candidatus Parvarchaeota archaeon]
MDAVILPRSNARFLSQSLWRKIVREIKRMGIESWMRERQYGKRWRVEIFFSALKRVMGEIIMTKKLKYQIMEYWMKICIINEKEYAGELNWLTHYSPCCV